METRVAIQTLAVTLRLREAAHAGNYEYYHNIADKEEGRAVREALRVRGFSEVDYELGMIHVKWLPVDAHSSEAERELALLTAQAIVEMCRK